MHIDKAPLGHGKSAGAQGAGRLSLGQETGKAKRMGNTSHGNSVEDGLGAAICSSTLGHLQLSVSVTPAPRERAKL